MAVAPSNERTSFTLTKGGPIWSPEKVGGFSGVIIEVDDVFATHDQLQKRGVEFAEAPRMEPWAASPCLPIQKDNTHGIHSPAKG